MAVTKTSADENYIVRVDSAEFDPLRVNYKFGINEPDHFRIESVTISVGRAYGNFMVSRANGKLLGKNSETDIKKISDLDERILAILRELPDNVRRIIQV